MRRSALLLLTAFALGGCVALTPYEEIRRALPSERFVDIDGQAVYVERRGAGEPVLLLHGFGASSYSWRHVAERLAESYRVIALDLNGFGYSERPHERSAYTVAGQLETILGVMDALGVDSAHVAGHSYGGALSLHLARRFPERVRSLVLVDSAGPEYPALRRNPAARLRPATALFIRAVAIRKRRIENVLERSVYDDAQVTPELVAAYFERVRIEGVVRAYRGLTVPVPDEADGFDLSTIEEPTLVIWGEQDELITVEVGRERTAGMPDARFVPLEETGHLPLEERPQAVATAMLEFLDSLTDRSK